MARIALETTSARFDSLQQLIDAIPQADDQKAILDLQARIAAEQGMLQNESSKLTVLYQAAQAQERGRGVKGRGSRPYLALGLCANCRRWGCELKATPMGFFAEFSTWLNALLATYIGERPCASPPRSHRRYHARRGVT